MTAPDIVSGIDGFQRERPGPDRRRQQSHRCGSAAPIRAPRTGRVTILWQVSWLAGSRLSFTFPASDQGPVVHRRMARRSQLRGQPRNRPDGLTAFPFHPAASHLSRGTEPKRLKHWQSADSRSRDCLQWGQELRPMSNNPGRMAIYAGFYGSSRAPAAGNTRPVGLGTDLEGFGAA